MFRFLKLSLSRLFLIAFLVINSLSQTPIARAQGTVFAAKDICEWNSAIPDQDPNICNQPSGNQVLPGQAVYYQLTLEGPSTIPATTWAMGITENYPAGFNVTGVNCLVAGATTPFITLSPPTQNPWPSIPVDTGQRVYCAIEGYFTVSNSQVPDATNELDIIATDLAGNVRTRNNLTAPAGLITSGVLPTDISITKTASPNSTFYDFTSKEAQATYTIRVENAATGSDVFIGNMFQIVDRLRRSGDNHNFSAQIVSGSLSCSAFGGADCIDASTPNPAGNMPNVFTGYSDFAKWDYAPGDGFLPAGGGFELTYTVRYKTSKTCVLDEQFSQIVENEAYFNLQKTPGVTISEQNSGNNTAASNPLSDVTLGSNWPLDPSCSDPPAWVPSTTAINKRIINPLPHDAANPLPWGAPITFEVTVTNNEVTALTNVNLRDYARLNNAPPYTATVLSENCVGCSGTPTSPVTVTSSGQSLQLWGANGFTIPGKVNPTDPPVTAVLTLTLKYDTNSCARQAQSSYSILNQAQVNFTYLGVNEGRSDQISIYMEEPTICEFEVSKTFDNGAPATLLFNTPYDYTVTLTNNLPSQVTIYSIYDRVRIDQLGYASGLGLDYSYSCTGAGVSGFSPASNSGSITVVTTSTPTQGAQIMQVGSSGAVFTPGGVLTCNVQLLLKPPVSGNPDCMGTGAAGLENFIGYHEKKGTVNPNVPPGANGVLWDSVRAPLPRCYNLVVKKSVTPSTVQSLGPDLNYTVDVLNNGDAISGLSSPDWLVISDVFTGPYTPSATPIVIIDGTVYNCTLPTDPCQWIAGTPPQLAIKAIAAGGSVNLTYPLLPNFSTPSVRNDVEIEGQGNMTTHWYPRTVNTLSTSAEVPVEFVPNSSRICIEKFNDLNGNGIRDAGEPDMEGIAFIIRDPGGTPIAFPETNSVGRFCTPPVLSDGDYEVEEIVPTGWTNTLPGNYPVIETVTLDQVSQIATLQFGNMELRPVLKLCKDADDKIPADAEFEFDVAGQTVSLNSGSCKIIDGNFDLEDGIKIKEDSSTGYIVTEIDIQTNGDVFTNDPPNALAAIGLGRGVNEVTFRNEYVPAFIEICKESDLDGMYEFDILPQPGTSISVPANACSGPIEVPAGMLTISESDANLLSDWTVLHSCQTEPLAALISCNQTSKAITINVPPGANLEQTIVTFKNKRKEKANP